MKPRFTLKRAARFSTLSLAGGVLAVALLATRSSDATHWRRDFDDRIRDNAQDQFKRGKSIFRDDTFGDEESGISSDNVKARFRRAKIALRKVIESRVGAHAPELFAFHLSRCDRIVERVRDRLFEAERRSA
jgi:hypothetical protein